MALQAITAAIDRGFYVDVAAVTENDKFHHCLREVAASMVNLRIHRWSRPYRSGEAVRQRFAWGARRRLRHLVQSCRPDAIILVQGCLEISSLPLACCKGLAPIISYLPLPHTWRQMGGRAAWLRDLVSQRLMHQPDAWITISEAQRQHLLQRGARQPITVVPNIFPKPAPQTALATTVNTQHQLDAAHKRLGLNHLKPTIGVFGRIEFKQKCQDQLLEHIQSTKDLQAVFVGDGPDAAALRQRIAAAGLADRVRWLPWPSPAENNNTQLVRDLWRDLWHSIDCLVIGSRYEGVPLVMLQALSQAIPVIAPNRDGMADVLPGEALLIQRYAADNFYAT